MCVGLGMPDATQMRTLGHNAFVKGNFRVIPRAPLLTACKRDRHRTTKDNIDISTQNEAHIQKATV
eukprot:scaffold5796_cov98-Skeletonema_marinoi.AAC.6